MPYLQIVAGGQFMQSAIRNVFWYITEPPTEPVLEEAELLLAGPAFDTQILAGIASVLPNSFTYTELVLQAYADDWARSPYLSQAMTISRVGGVASGPMGPINAMVLSARVQPVTVSPKGLPVTRGYLSLGPVPATYISADGIFIPAILANAANVAARNAFKANLTFGTSPARVMRPIRVSAPNISGARGWGYIRDVITRPAMSTRRSRKPGIGV